MAKNHDRHTRPNVRRWRCRGSRSSKGYVGDNETEERRESASGAPRKAFRTTAQEAAHLVAAKCLPCSTMLRLQLAVSDSNLYDRLRPSVAGPHPSTSSSRLSTCGARGHFSRRRPCRPISHTVYESIESREVLTLESLYRCYSQMSAVARGPGQSHPRLDRSLAAGLIARAFGETPLERLPDD